MAAISGTDTEAFAPREQLAAALKNLDAYQQLARATRDYLSTLRLSDPPAQVFESRRRAWSPGGDRALLDPSTVATRSACRVRRDNFHPQYRVRRSSPAKRSPGTSRSAQWSDRSIPSPRRSR